LHLSALICFAWSGRQSARLLERFAARRARFSLGLCSIRELVKVVLQVFVERIDSAYRIKKVGKAAEPSMTIASEVLSLRFASGATFASELCRR